RPPPRLILCSVGALAVWPGGQWFAVGRFYRNSDRTLGNASGNQGAHFVWRVFSWHATSIVMCEFCPASGPAECVVCGFVHPGDAPKKPLTEQQEKDREAIAKREKILDSIQVYMWRLRFFR